MNGILLYRMLYEIQEHIAVLARCITRHSVISDGSSDIEAETTHLSWVAAAVLVSDCSLNCSIDKPEYSMHENIVTVEKSLLSHILY